VVEFLLTLGDYSRNLESEAVSIVPRNPFHFN